MHSTSKRVMSHLDKPKRFVSFTMDELVVLVFGLMLLVTSTQKWLVGCFIGLIYAVLKELKQGQDMRFLMIRMYWTLPIYMTEVWLPNLPASYQRVWRA